MTKLIFTIVFILLLLGSGFYFGMLYKTQHPDIAEQPKPAPAESWEVPATVTDKTTDKVSNYIIPAKYITVYDTVTVNEPVKNLHKLTSKSVRKPDKLTTTLATFPLRFTREDASFQADITYRYSDKIFVVENPAFTPPKAKVVYRDRFFKFSSGVGFLRGLNGNNYAGLQPINFRIWKFNIKPTALFVWDKLKKETDFAYGGFFELDW